MCFEQKYPRVKSILIIPVGVSSGPLYSISIDNKMHHKTSNKRRNLVYNKIVDHSDVVGTSPVGAAPTTSSFST